MGPGIASVQNILELWHQDNLKNLNSWNKYRDL